jgi:hypothetical protein
MSFQKIYTCETTDIFPGSYSRGAYCDECEVNVMRSRIGSQTLRSAKFEVGIGCFFRADSVQRLRLLLAEWADETLALAIQKNCFRKHCFEELLVHRYEAALRRWFYRQTGDWDRVLDLLQGLYLHLLNKLYFA